MGGSYLTYAPPRGDTLYVVGRWNEAGVAPLLALSISTLSTRELTRYVNMGIPFATDDAFVYLKAGVDGVARVSFDGRTAERLGSFELFDPPLALYGDAIYAEGDGQLKRLRKDRPGPAERIASIPAARGLAVDASGIYFLALNARVDGGAGPSVVMRAPLAGGSAQPVLTLRGIAMAIAVTDACMWWLEQGGVFRAPKP
jgi:hypothetical protein